MIFTLQTRTVRITTGVKSRNSCRNMLMRLEILPFPCEYVFMIMNFVVSNQEHFHRNSAIHSVNTRNRDHLYRPTVNFLYFEKSAYYHGFKIFYCPPSFSEILRIERHSLK